MRRGGARRQTSLSIAIAIAVEQPPRVSPLNRVCIVRTLNVAVAVWKNIHLLAWPYRVFFNPSDVHCPALF